jgi:hypothetical protein
MLTGLKLHADNTTTAYLDVNWDDYSSLRFLNLGGVLMNLIAGLMVICPQCCIFPNSEPA